jgi:hypothetical protein
MNARSLIVLLILITFLPAATGCSASRTIRLDEDPADNESAVRFQSGEAVEVNGYTRPDDGFRSWRGFVQTVPQDSLAFESRPPEGMPSISFRLARTDVISIDAREYSQGRTTALTLASMTIVALVVAGVILAANPIGVGDIQVLP